MSETLARQYGYLYILSVSLNLFTPTSTLTWRDIYAYGHCILCVYF